VGKAARFLDQKTSHFAHCPAVQRTRQTPGVRRLGLCDCSLAQLRGGASPSGVSALVREDKEALVVQTNGRRRTRRAAGCADGGLPARQGRQERWLRLRREPPLIQSCIVSATAALQSACGS